MKDKPTEEGIKLIRGLEDISYEETVETVWPGKEKALGSPCSSLSAITGS